MADSNNISIIYDSSVKEECTNAKVDITSVFVKEEGCDPEEEDLQDPLESDDEAAFTKPTQIEVDGKLFYQCPLSDYKSPRSTDVIRHIKTHFKTPAQSDRKSSYNCPFCDYKSCKSPNMARHIRSHTGEKPFSCAHCKSKYYFSTSVLLSRHMRFHTGERSFECSSCIYKAYQKKDLIDHQKVHTGERPFSCRFCNYKCSQKSNLTRHLRTHTGEKPFSCHLCKHKSGSSWNLKKHMGVHENKEVNIAEGNEDNKSEISLSCNIELPNLYMENNSEQFSVKTEHFGVKTEQLHIKEENL